MAGKLKMPTMESPLFSLNPVDRKTLNNWRPQIDEAQLRIRLIDLMNMFPQITIEYNDSRQLGNLIETLQEVQGLYTNTTFKAILSTDCSINGFACYKALDHTVLTVANGATPDAIMILLVANTYRAIVQELTGPIPGYNFNVTIAGIVALCMRFGVPIHFDS